LIDAIESNKIRLKIDQKQRAKELYNIDDWEQADSRRVWTYGLD
jgi:hypothetical protein